MKKPNILPTKLLSYILLTLLFYCGSSCRTDEEAEMFDKQEQEDLLESEETSQFEGLIDLYSTNSGNITDADLQEYFQSEHGLDFHQGIKDLKQAIARIDTSATDKALKSAKASDFSFTDFPYVEELGLGTVKLSWLATYYLNYMASDWIIPQDGYIGKDLTFSQQKVEINKRILALRKRIADDTRLSKTEKDALLNGCDVFYANTSYIASFLYQELNNQSGPVHSPNGKQNGFSFKKLWRRVRSVVVSTVVVTVVSAIVCGPPCALLFGGLTLIATLVDMEVNNECHYAAHCPNGQVEDCDTGDCRPRKKGYNYTPTQGGPNLNLTGPKTFTTSTGANSCRGCGVTHTEDVKWLSPNVYNPKASSPFSYNTFPFGLDGAVDMSKAPAGSQKNALGWPRNSKWFWKRYEDPYNALSPKNLAEIAKGNSPTVDPQWKLRMPGESNARIGEIIEHHHVNRGRYAIPLSFTNHRSVRKLYSNLHPRFKSSVVFARAKTIFGRTGKTIIGSASIFADVYSSIRDAYSEDPRAFTNQIFRYEENGIMWSPISGLKDGRIYYIVGEDIYIYVQQFYYNDPVTPCFQWILYEDYGYDAEKEEYIGVGVINRGGMGICDARKGQTEDKISLK